MPDIENIDNVLAGKASASVKEAVYEWFASSAGQSFLSKRMDEDIAQEQYGGEIQVPSASIWAGIQERLVKKQRLSLRKLWIWTAAAVAVVALCIPLYRQLFVEEALLVAEEYCEVRVPAGENLNIVFPDGSKACVNACSLVKYPREFNSSRREIYLDGEAFFNIEHQLGIPFEVKLSRGSVVVTGTSFNVNAYSVEETITVFLETGKVHYCSSEEKLYELNEGQMLEFNKDSNTVSVYNEPAMKAESEWMKNVLSFNDAPLQNVLNELSRKFVVDFQIEDPEALQYRITSYFENESLKQVLSGLESIAPIVFSVEGNTIKVTKR